LGKPLFDKDLESLIQLALDNNFDLAGKKLAVDAAKQELNKARAGFLPSVDIVASVSRNDQESITTLNQEYTNRSVGVELMWPLAKGGYHASLMRQNEAKLQQARQDEESGKVRVRVDVNRQYRGAENGHAKAGALSNAIRSSEKAVASVSMGFKAGTRTSVDILNAKKEWIKVRKDYVDSMRDFIIAKLKLEAAAGALDESHLRWADNFFMPQK
jgi:protease secretion system outer membrane protein